MLAGMPISCCTLLTAFTASPSDALGAKLKDRVTTGNCPWWFTVIGTVVCSARVKALSGTWPPLLNTADDAETVELTAVVLEAPGVVGAGPRLPALADPPATTPAPPKEDPVEERMYRSRKSPGSR